MAKHVRRTIGILVGAAVLAAPAPALGAGWVYVESNSPQRGENSVLALKYGSNGKLNPINMREFRTRGTGAAYIRDMSVGTLAGDQQVTLSADRKWLFTVNQGSDTIAVFRVDRGTGGLTHVKGSPFDSGGKAPISVGFNGRHLVVANHGVVAPFVPGPAADFGNPNFTSFSVSGTGRLKKISTDGVTLPPFLPPGIEKLPFGIATHPTQPYAYILGPANLRVAIYRFNAAGELTFTGQEDNPGGVAACWIVLTSDGRYAFAANTFTQDISVFRVSQNGSDLTFLRKVPLPSTGTTFNLAIDPTDRYLYAHGGHADPDGPRPQEVNPDGSVGAAAPADGNFLEAFRIGTGGTLRSIGTTALPVRFSTIPMGIQVLGQQRSR